MVQIYHNDNFNLLSILKIKTQNLFKSHNHEKTNDYIVRI